MPSSVGLSSRVIHKKALRAFETSVTVYQSTQHNVTERLSFQQNRCENLKSRISKAFERKKRYGEVTVCKDYGWCASVD
jgi:hypothetical protein